MVSETQALVASEVNAPLKLETIAVDKLQPDEALVEIHASGVCHTDASCIDGTLPAQFPAVFGHEGGGIVLDVGSEVKDVSKGDKVLLSFASCGDCAQCTSAHPAYCYTFGPSNFGQLRTDGTSALSKGSGDKVFGRFFGQSSFAHHAVVHKTSLVKVPSDTPVDLFCPLGCGLQTGAGAVFNTLNVKEGSTLAVFGCGGVGMSAIMAGKIRGASQIIAVDLQPSRLELAKELGATSIINGGDADVVQQILKLCPPNGVSFAAECTGVPKVVETMVDSLGTKGRGATIGAPAPGKRAGVDIFSHLILGREYVGCCTGDSNAKVTIPALIEYHKKGQFPLEKLITYYDVKDHEQAFADAKAGKTIKAVLRFR